jgi:hypothetical protein
MVAQQCAKKYLTQPKQQTKTISDAVRRRAYSIITDRSIDRQWRAVIRYGLETNDPLLPDLVQHVDARDEFSEAFDVSLTSKPSSVTERDDDKL